MKSESKKETEEKEKTMKLSIKEGAVASVMTGAGDGYITPFALALNANNAQIGFLSSFPGLIAPIAQIFGSKMMEKYSRRKIMYFFTFLQSLMWLPLILLAFFFNKNILTSHLPIILLAFYTIYAVFGAVAGPSWFSLMGEIIPESIRGKYFSKRNKIATTIFIISTIIAAFILDFFKTKGLVLAGFSIIFFLAFISRAISSRMLKKHKDVKFKFKKDYYFTIWQFIKKSPENNFGKFVIFIALMYFAAMISGPFFSVYMLKDLKFSYTTFMIVNISASLFSVIFLPILGKFSDKYGNREMLKVSSIFVSLIPILWIFSSSPVYLILAPQLIAGMGWAAFNLAVNNFIYDSVTPQRRGICVAYLNVLVGIGIFSGAFIGGLLAQYISITFMNILLFIFLISGAARILVTLLMIPKIKEIKQKREKPVLLYVEDIFFSPLKGLKYKLYSNFHSVKKRLGIFGI
ncbi:MFS transporter [Candidatus Pacearchaeota archaeon]|nr:MFS transporter [Candidatus Pacearchaeota archaeon]